MHSSGTCVGLSVGVLFLSLRDFLGLLGLCGCVCVSLLVCGGGGGVLYFVVLLCGLSGSLVCVYGV